MQDTRISRWTLEHLEMKELRRHCRAKESYVVPRQPLGILGKISG